MKVIYLLLNEFIQNVNVFWFFCISKTGQNRCASGVHTKFCLKLFQFFKISKVFSEFYRKFVSGDKNYIFMSSTFIKMIISELYFCSWKSLGRSSYWWDFRYSQFDQFQICGLVNYWHICAVMLYMSVSLFFCYMYVCVSLHCVLYVFITLICVYMSNSVICGHMYIVAICLYMHVRTIYGYVIILLSYFSIFFIW